ncbi:MAG: hypothetical protein Q9162_005541 [Coniocarpon cinnabarinum]
MFKDKTRHVADVALRIIGGATLTLAGICSLSKTARSYVFSLLTAENTAWTSTTSSSGFPKQDAEPVDSSDVLPLTLSLDRALNGLIAANEVITARSNEVQLVDEHNRRTHRLLTSLLFPSDGAAVRTVQRPDLLDHPLLPIPPESGLDSDCATLVGIEDAKTGKLHALILGVDSAKWSREADVGLPGQMLNMNAFEHVWRWLYGMGTELFHQGETAGENSIPVYVWHKRIVIENALDAGRPNFLALDPGEMEARFPIQTLKRATRITTSRTETAIGDFDKLPTAETRVMELRDEDG